MLEKDVKEYIENDINYYLSHFPKATREAAEQMMLQMRIYTYVGDGMSKEDLQEYADCLGYTLNMEAIEKYKKEFYEEHPELKGNTKCKQSQT